VPFGQGKEPSFIREAAVRYMIVRDVSDSVSVFSRGIKSTEDQQQEKYWGNEEDSISNGRFDERIPRRLTALLGFLFVTCLMLPRGGETSNNKFATNTISGRDSTSNTLQSSLTGISNVLRSTRLRRGSYMESVHGGSTAVSFCSTTSSSTRYWNAFARSKDNKKHSHHPSPKCHHRHVPGRSSFQEPTARTLHIIQPPRSSFSLPSYFTQLGMRLPFFKGQQTDMSEYNPQDGYDGRRPLRPSFFQKASPNTAQGGRGGDNDSKVQVAVVEAEREVRFWKMRIRMYQRLIRSAKAEVEETKRSSLESQRRLNRLRQKDPFDSSADIQVLKVTLEAREDEIKNLEQDIADLETKKMDAQTLLEAQLKHLIKMSDKSGSSSESRLSTTSNTSTVPSSNNATAKSVTSEAGETSSYYQVIDSYKKFDDKRFWETESGDQQSSSATISSSNGEFKYEADMEDDPEAHASGDSSCGTAADAGIGMSSYTTQNGAAATGGKTDEVNKDKSNVVFPRRAVHSDDLRALVRETEGEVAGTEEKMKETMKTLEKAKDEKKKAQDRYNFLLSELRSLRKSDPLDQSIVNKMHVKEAEEAKASLALIESKIDRAALRLRTIQANLKYSQKQLRKERSLLERVFGEAAKAIEEAESNAKKGLGKDVPGTRFLDKLLSPFAILSVLLSRAESRKLSSEHIGWLKRDKSLPGVQDKSERFNDILLTMQERGPENGMYDTLRKDVFYIFVPGFLWQIYPDYFSSTVKAFRNSGLQAKLCSQVGGASGVYENAAAIRREILDAHSASNKTVVLITHSKGGIDSAGALALYKDELMPLVRGIVFCQCPYGGAPLATDLTGDPVHHTLAHWMRKYVRGSWQSVLDMMYQNRRDFLKKHPLPSELASVSFHSSTNSPTSIQQLLTRYVKKRYGMANDGLVIPIDAEVPGSSVVKYEKELDHVGTVWPKDKRYDGTTLESNVNSEKKDALPLDLGNADEQKGITSYRNPSMRKPTRYARSVGWVMVAVDGILRKVSRYQPTKRNDIPSAPELFGALVALLQEDERYSLHHGKDPQLHQGSNVGAQSPAWEFDSLDTEQDDLGVPVSSTSTP